MMGWFNSTTTAALLQNYAAGLEYAAVGRWAPQFQQSTGSGDGDGRGIVSGGGGGVGNN